MKIVYKTTYPNGKIYVGQDVTDSINYFGNASSIMIAADFSCEERQSFTMTREVFWESDNATDAEVAHAEREWIGRLSATDPTTGYNRWPRRARAL